MNFRIIIAIYWSLCIIGTFIFMIRNKKKNRLIDAISNNNESFGKRIVTFLCIILFVPILMPFILLYQVIKGVKTLYYKNRPRPVPKDKRRFLKPDTVFDENNTSMSLTEYNFKHNTSFTLDQVYGKGYESSLSEEQRKDYHKNNENHGVLTIQEDLSNDDHTSFAIHLAHALIEGDFDKIEQALNENVETILYKNRTVKGKSETLEYWKGWRDKYVVTKDLTTFEVKRSNYYYKACLLIEPMLIMFYFEGGLVKKILLIQRYLSPTIGHHDDMLDFPFSFDKVKGNLSPLHDPNEFTEAVEKNNRIPCMHCGEASENLEWYNSDFKCGVHGYRGQVSVCPHCGKVVEYFPEIRLRYDDPQFDEEYKPQTEGVEQSKAFFPSLCGIRYFDNTTPLKGTNYVDSLPSDVLVDENLFFGNSKPEFGPCSIKQIAEDSNWILIPKVMERYPEHYEAIKECYRKAVADGIFEAANNLGILVYNFDNNIEEGNKLFNLSAFHGSKDAKLNQFTALWSEEKYLDCAAMLKFMPQRDNPSIKCLWNYAYFLFFGKDYPNNLIEKDIDKAKSILALIVSTNYSHLSENEKDLPPKAVQFLHYIETANIYSEKGEAYHKILTESVVKTDSIKDKSEVFGRLSFLKMKDGYHLGLRLADMNTTNIGDESNFFVYDESDKEDTDILRYIEVVPSAMAAWQVYLLMTSPTVMPVFWHGGYIRRKFIFQKSDLDTIKALDYLDTSCLTDIVQILPHIHFTPVEKSENGIGGYYQADVYCCYWNDWKGLVREHARILMNNIDVISYSIEDDDVLYEYDCKIMF